MRLKSRAAAIGVASTLFLLIVFVLSGPSAAVVAYRLIVEGGLILAWLMTAAVIGRLLLRKKLTDLLGLVTMIALGLGVIGLVVLGLGLAGWLNHSVALAILAVGSAACLFRMRKFDDGAAKRWLTAPANWGWLWLAAMPAAAIAVVGALLPPGLLWGDEPNGYDVVEYHLQIPRQWFESARITPLQENVFSFFPQQVEIHYLLAMEVHNGAWPGMYAAQLMHVAFCVLAVLAITAVAGSLAGVVIAVTPWVLLLAPIAYVEGGVLLYGALAVAWAMQSISRRGLREMTLAGAMAGFACGVKLTDVPMLMIAIPIATIAIDRTDWIWKTGAFLAVALLAFSPWLARNAIWSGNPVFPEAMNLLGKGNFSDAQVDRWRRAYVPTTGRLPAFGSQIVFDDRYGFLLLPAALAAGAIGFRSPRSRYLLMMLGMIAFVWIAFTHLQSRFFILAIPIAGLLLAEVRWRWWQPCVAGLVCFLLACQLATTGPRITHYLSDMRGNEILGREDLTGLTRPDPAKLAPDVHVDLIGDARAFLYPFPMTRMTYRTVFDVGTSGNVIWDWLGTSGVPPHHLLVINPAELHRLHRTYYQIADLSDDELARLAARPDVYVISPEH